MTKVVRSFPYDCKRRLRKKENNGICLTQTDHTNRSCGNMLQTPHWLKKILVPSYMFMTTGVKNVLKPFEGGGLPPYIPVRDVPFLGCLFMQKINFGASFLVKSHTDKLWRVISER